MAKDKDMMREGSKNGRWKGGKSSDYRRRATGAKPGQIVHHKNEDKSDNKKSNFEIIKPTKTMSATGVHNQRHPSKGKAAARARMKNNNNKKC